ncbi:MAG TPA: hypothetical protein VFP17_08225, partial [Solirubrobacterales bacterium]|nr:hypothetical protein [Solirubrobacterales bacterium]
MAQQTKSKGKRKPKSSASKSDQRVHQSTAGSGRNKSPRQKKDEQEKKEQGSNGGAKARNQGSDKTRPEQIYEDYTVIDPGEISDTDEPDVIVDIPVVKVDEIHFELDDLMARVSLHAEVLDLVKLSVGVHVELGKVELNIKG